MRICKVDIYFGILLIYHLSIYIVRGDIYGTEKAYLFPGYGILYFIIRKLIGIAKFRNNINHICILWCAFEIVICYAQIFNIIDNQEIFFSFGGTFGNPNAVAGFFSILLPFFVANTIGTISKNKEYYVYFTITMLMIGLIIQSKSRGAWLAVLVSCLFVLYKMKKNLSVFQILNQSKRWKKILSIIILCVTLTGTLYFIKPESAFGRLLIWKVSLLTFCKFSLFGEGISSFYANYGKWQSKYFQEYGGTEHERYVADYVTSAYNEFIEIYIEQGLIGLVLLLLFIFFVAKLKLNCVNRLTIGAQGTLLSILVLSFVSYPLSLNSYCIILLINLSILALYSKKHTFISNKYKRICVLFITIIAVYIFAQICKYEYGKIILQKGVNTHILGDICESKKMLEKASVYIPNSGNLLFQLGGIYYVQGDYYEALSYYKKAMKSYSDPHLYYQLGECSLIVGDSISALDYYQTSSYMIPNSLYPKYRLLVISKQMGNKIGALSYAHEILETPIKVSTIHAKEIKNEAYKYVVNFGEE